MYKENKLFTLLAFNAKLNWRQKCYSYIETIVFHFHLTQ